MYLVVGERVIDAGEGRDAVRNLFKPTFKYVWLKILSHEEEMGAGRSERMSREDCRTKTDLTIYGQCFL